MPKRRRSKSFNCDISFIMDACDNTRTQNIKLKTDLMKTTALLKQQFENIIKENKSLHY